MPATERYYKKIPIKQKAKRAKGSPSFMGILRTEIAKVRTEPSFNRVIQTKYIVRGNEELLAKTKIESSPITDPRAMVCGKIRLSMKNKGGEDIVVFAAHTTDKKSWNIFHRKVDPDYRGLNLGRVSFRLMELTIKELGGKTIVAGTSDIRVINTLLGLGWNVHKKYIRNLKTLLGLKRFSRLPPVQEIRQQFREMKVKNDLLPLGLTLIKKMG